jgi:Antimicrobial peptide resistance and lipid A acylation protein PagP
MGLAARILCLALGLAAFCHNAAAQSDSAWDVVLNGRSVHMNATYKWNEDNWGLGIEREFASSSPWIKVALANGFKDSMGDLSYMAGGGLKRRFWVRSDDFYVDLGGIAFVMTREEVKHNKPFPGVLPAATFQTGRAEFDLSAGIRRESRHKFEEVRSLDGRRLLPATQARCQLIRARSARSAVVRERPRRLGSRPSRRPLSSCVIVGRTAASSAHSNAYDLSTRNDR